MPASSPGGLRTPCGPRPTAWRELLFNVSEKQPEFTRIREEPAPIADELVARAQRDGHLRADLTGTDLPQIELMISSVAEYARGVSPDLWRRYLTLMIDGLRARPEAPTPLPVEALTHEQTEQALCPPHLKRRRT